MAQCLHERETQAVSLRKKGPVCRRAVSDRALYPEFLYEGTRLRGALKAEKRYIWGAC